MRKFKLFTTMVAAFLLAGLIFAQPLQADELSTITVNGTGTVSMAPDIATVSLGVSTQDANPREALAENNILTTAVIDVLLELGIDKDDIRTAHFFIDPVFGMDWTTITGYRVSNTITVTLRDIDIVGDVLGVAVAAGANISHGVTFGISDSTEAYEQALVLAIQSAQRKAHAMAIALDTEIIARVSVVELAGIHMPTMHRSFGGAVAMEADMMAWGGVPIEAGDLTITANVQIVYSVAP